MSQPQVEILHAADRVQATCLAIEAAIETLLARIREAGR